MPAAPPAKPRWSIVIHGGAGTITRAVLDAAQDSGARAGLTAALAAGSAVLEADGTALDAVEEAVRVLEDDPHFNAGHGAAYTRNGRNELDAAIMDGRNRTAGAVTGVTRTRNPVSLARTVMTHSPHVLLSGDGADRFSAEHRLDQVDPSYFATAERRRQLDELLASGSNGFDSDMKYGTVGAVAVDVRGHVAAATSTGGVTGKRWGRIGDSPVIGAGTYADDRAGAVSATGAGEYFIRVGAAHEICARVRLTGETMLAAGEAVIAELTAIGGAGGVILIAPDGTGGWRFNTPGMYRGRAASDAPAVVAIYGDE